MKRNCFVVLCLISLIGLTIPAGVMAEDFTLTLTRQLPEIIPEDYYSILAPDWKQAKSLSLKLSGGVWVHYGYEMEYVRVNPKSYFGKQVLASGLHPDPYKPLTIRYRYAVRCMNGKEESFSVHYRIKGSNGSLESINYGLYGEEYPHQFFLDPTTKKWKERKRNSKNYIIEANIAGWVIDENQKNYFSRLQKRDQFIDQLRKRLREHFLDKQKKKI